MKLQLLNACLLLIHKSLQRHRQFRVADFIKLPELEDQEIDIEGLAYAGHYLWFVGSHSWKRKKPKSDKNDEKNIKRLTNLNRKQTVIY
jgi:hypothetical protein